MRFTVKVHNQAFWYMHDVLKNADNVACFGWTIDDSPGYTVFTVTFLQVDTRTLPE